MMTKGIGWKLKGGEGKEGDGSWEFKLFDHYGGASSFFVFWVAENMLGKEGYGIGSRDVKRE